MRPACLFAVRACAGRAGGGGACNDPVARHTRGRALIARGDRKGWGRIVMGARRPWRVGAGKGTTTNSVGAGWVELEVACAQACVTESASATADRLH